MKKFSWIPICLFLFLTGCQTQQKNQTPARTRAILSPAHSIATTDINKLYGGKIPIEKSDYVPFVKDRNSQFSLVVIPDTQGYTDYLTYNTYSSDFPFSNIDILDRQIDFIIRNSVKNNGDFSFVAHVGDLVNWPISHKQEWQLALDSLSPLIGEIPYIIVPGNHDFNWWVSGYVSNLSSYKKFFGVKSKFFKDQEFLGGFNSSATDLWCKFHACGMDFIVIGLEFEPSDASLKWAQKVIDSNPGLPVIIVTHGMKDSVSDQARYDDKKYRKNKKYNTGEYVWDKLIKKNDTIFLVISGHSFSKNSGGTHRMEKNACGNTTYAIMANYQGRKDVLKYYGIENADCQYCGDGWIQTLNFDMKEKTIHVKTYSTEFGAYEMDSDSDFYLPIDWDWNKRFSSSQFSE